MAVYESKYRGLTFYVNDRLYSFNDGQFASDETEVIAVLDKITDAKRTDSESEPEEQEPVEPEDKPEVTADEPETQTEEITEPVAKAKPATPRKPKASAK